VSKLRIVAYNVHFGDAILVEIPDRDGSREVNRHVLFDVGNVLTGAGGDDAVFEPIVRDILERLEGKPIDLYIMSHEHLDHVQGLRYAAERGLAVPVSYAWLTVSAAPDYYEKHPTAARKLAIAQDHLEVVKVAAVRRGLLDDPFVRTFIANNDRASTQTYVEYLRTMAPATRYVHRGFSPEVGTDHSFAEVQFRVWGPEENTAVYYGGVTPFIAKVSEGAEPPPGVDREAFRELMAFLELGMPESMLAIDRAANDTSVVLEIEWRGWRLLFPGDAEQRSWQLMARNRMVRPVHLFKVGHHGSRNGLPPGPVLEQLLPAERPDSRQRTAILSTYPETYPGVPDELTLARLKARVDQLITTRSVGSAKSVTVELEGDS
jgi:hypothetical protein